MLGGNIDDVKDSAPMGIKSVLKEVGGLPVPDNEATDTDGDSEYARPSAIEGTLTGAESNPLEVEPYIWALNASFSRLSSSF